MPRSAPVFLLACALACASSPAAQVLDATFVTDGQFHDVYARAVALDGDTLAFGGSADDGTVYVYTDDGAWSEQQRFGSALLGDQPSRFAWALDLSGDALVVGAWNASDGSWLDPGYQRGAAVVFRRAGEVWSEEQLLQPAAVAEDDQFGRAVAIDGDVIAVGAPAADPAGERSGRVWVFRRVGGAWIVEDVLVAPDAAAEFRFGEALDVSGDTLAVGAPVSDGAAVDAGAVYVFRHAAGAWSLEQTLGDFGGAPDDRFGASVALDDDTLAVGVPRRAVGGVPAAGSVAAYSRVGTSWTLDACLTGSAPRAIGNLGASVALDGDRLLAGLPGDDTAAPKGGAIVVFTRSGGAWGEAVTLVSPAALIGDGVGYGVAVDGARAAVVARRREQVSPIGASGAVDVWTGLPGGSP